MGVRINYTALGLFVLLLGGGLIYGIYWFSSTHDKKIYKPYIIYFSESISGISEETPVKYYGVNVGTVTSIQINNQNLREIKVLVEIAEDTPITEDTYATIISRGITGLAYIGLKNETINGKPIQISKGEDYPVIQSRPSLFVELDQAMDEVLEKFKILMNKIEKLLDEENQQSFKNMLTNLEQVTKILSNRSQEIDKSIVDTKQILDQFSMISVKIPDVLESFANSLKTFDKLSYSIEQASQKFSNTMDVTNKMVTNVNQQIVGNISQSIGLLDKLLLDTNRLVTEIQSNPASLVRGQKITKYGPGERP